MKGIYKTHADYSHGGFFTEKAVAEQVRFLEFQADCKWDQNGKRLVNFSEVPFCHFDLSLLEKSLTSKSISGILLQF